MSRHRRHNKLEACVSDALVKQTQLLRFTSSAQGHRFLHGFANHDGGMSPTFDVMPHLREEHAFATWERHTLINAETFTVEPDMHQLVMAMSHGDARDTLPERIAPHELIAPIGFLHVPQGILTKDISDVRYPIQSLAWRYPVYLVDPNTKQEYAAVAFSFYSPVVDDDKLRAEYPLPERWIEQFKQQHTLLHFALGSLDDIRPAWDLGEYGRAFQYLIMFWLVANQQLAHISRPPSDAQGLALGAARKERIVTKLHIVRLRRERLVYENQENDNTRDYTHRWNVRAHWRKQACGPNHEDRKWVLVQAHIKGPEDKPLIVKQRAYVLDR